MASPLAASLAPQSREPLKELTVLSPHQMNTYKPLSDAFSHGEGAWLHTTDVRRILYGLACIPVSGLLHSHPKLTHRLGDQSGKLLHTPNLVDISMQSALTDMLSPLAGM